MKEVKTYIATIKGIEPQTFKRRFDAITYMQKKCWLEFGDAENWQKYGSIQEA